MFFCSSYFDARVGNKCKKIILEECEKYAPEYLLPAQLLLVKEQKLSNK